MKQLLTKQTVLFVGCLVFAFLFGIGLTSLFYSHSATAHTKDGHGTTIAACKGNNACITDLLSVFSKQKLTELNSGNEGPSSGFCLQVPVLLYHHVQPEQDAQIKGQTSLTVDSGIFDQQMAYIASKGYHTLTAQQLVDAILSHTQVPANSVVITLDDGYLDNYVYAYPVFQKYHLIANLMVPTGLLGVTSGTNTYYTWDQLKEMVGSGLISVYNHTWSHYPLASGPADKDTFEMKTAEDQLKQHFGSASNILVYPYGSGQNLPWVWNLVKQDGFVAAFSTLYGRFDCEGNLFALPRIHIGNAPLSSYGI